MGIKKRFKIADSFQQMIGGFLLAGPFIVEGGTWELAAGMKNLHAIVLTFIIMIIGYAALYKADKGRDVAKERKLHGIPLRFISLITVSISSVLILTFLLSAQQTMQASNITTLKALVIASVFSTIGAATADSIFPNQRSMQDTKQSVQPA